MPDKFRDAVRHHKELLPTFGRDDIYIHPDCNINEKSGSYFGTSYQRPEELNHNTEEARKYLAGSQYFRVKDIEVFKIAFTK
jgi:hypothetical protein